MKIPMKLGLYLFILLWLSSCGKLDKVDDKRNFNLTEEILNKVNLKKDIPYEPISLHLKGKPILTLGQHVQEIRNTIHFREDPNGRWGYQTNLIKDHVSTDDKLSIALEEGGINGILYFSSEEKEHRIFAIGANWTIDTKINEKSKEKISQLIVERLFPVLEDKLKIEDGWKYTQTKANFVEHFSINAPNENRHYWNMRYEIAIK